MSFPLLTPAHSINIKANNRKSCFWRGGTLFYKHLKELVDWLEEVKPKRFNVVVMPDFFLDRFVFCEGHIESLFDSVLRVASRKGGGIDGVQQVEFRGGNAVNTASALASLGAKVHLIVETSPLGLKLLEFYLEPLGVDLSRVKAEGKTSFTTSLEFTYENTKVNVMLRDLGSLPSFGLDKLEADDFKLLENAEYVCVFNWAGTRNKGTELAEGVFRHVKTRGKGKTYYDTADPSPNKEKIPQLVERVLLAGLVDIFSVNENEAVWYASQLSQEVNRQNGKMRLEELAKKSARILARKMSARVDLHTTEFAASLSEKSEVIVSAFKVPVLRVTGAGDAWNAGNIFGDAHGLSDSCRLTLANAVAAYYISSPQAKHPTLQELTEFCRNQLSKEKKG